MNHVDVLTAVELTPSQALQGQILQAAQELYLKAVFTEMTLALAIVDLSSNPNERLANELARAFDGGKRAFILELLEYSENAKIELKILQQTGNK